MRNLMIGLSFALLAQPACADPTMDKVRNAMEASARPQEKARIADTCRWNGSLSGSAAIASGLAADGNPADRRDPTCTRPVADAQDAVSRSSPQ